MGDRGNIKNLWKSFRIYLKEQKQKKKKKEELIILNRYRNRFKIFSLIILTFIFRFILFIIPKKEKTILKINNKIEKTKLLNDFNEVKIKIIKSKSTNELINYKKELLKINNKIDVNNKKIESDIKKEINKINNKIDIKEKEEKSNINEQINSNSINIKKDKELIINNNNNETNLENNNISNKVNHLEENYHTIFNNSINLKEIILPAIITTSVITTIMKNNKENEKITNLKIEVQKNNIKKQIINKPIKKNQKEIKAEKIKKTKLDDTKLELLQAVTYINKQLKLQKEIIAIQKKPSKIRFFNKLIKDMLSTSIITQFLFKNPLITMFTNAVVMNNNVRSMRKSMNRNIDYLDISIKEINIKRKDLKRYTDTVLSNSLYQINAFRNEILYNYGNQIEYNYDLKNTLLELDKLTEYINKQKEIINKKNKIMIKK